jgi:hypothetical protein
MHIIASFGALLVVLGFSGGAWSIWDKSGFVVVPAGRYLIAAGLTCVVFFLLSSLTRDRSKLKLSSFLDARVWVLGLAAIFFSDWICRPWGLFKGPSIRGELILASLVMWTLLASSVWRSVLIFWPICAGALLIWSFFLASGGSLLFSDDHAMFIFRLNLLKENFPSIPFWSPLWNAGFDARDFFATGALNAFFLAAPFIYLFPVESVYPFLVSSMLWILLPLSVYCSARLVKVEKTGAAIAATLAMCSGLFWYRWSLKYGTLGFVTSTCLFPLVIAVAIRHITSNNPSWRSSIAVALLTTLMLLWSPSGIAALPVAILAFPRLPHMLRSPRHLCAIILLVALNLPWISMMWKVSKVGSFLETKTAVSSTQNAVVSSEAGSHSTATNPPAENSTYRHKGGGFSARNTLLQWQNNATALNPLLVVFALPALLSFSGLGRMYFVILSAWLFLLGTVGVSLKPQLELDRMIVIASVLLTIPVGAMLTTLFAAANTGRLWRYAASCAGAFVLVGPFAAASVVLNRSDDTYSFARQEMTSLVRVIENNAGDGRVFFTGCVLHELSGGHLGPLPLWTKTPMVASSYAHNIWKYEQPIPQSYLQRGDEGIREFLDLMNASLVVAHEPLWIEYLRSRPAEYSTIWRGNDFIIFKRLLFSPSYALSGEIEKLTFTSRSVTFTPKTEQVVLKFKHFPFLKATGCTLQGFNKSPELKLIELSHCTPGQPVTLHSVSPLSRLLETPA